MPPHLINYIKNSIYKIVCKDENVTDLYVGRTCDITRRKYQHKNNCNTKNEYLYNYINLNGGWNNWEFIIVNDASTDNTEQILLKYKDDKRFNIIHLSESVGCHEARNAGLVHVEGEYIAIQDADDVSTPDRFNICMSSCYIKKWCSYSKYFIIFFCKGSKKLWNLFCH